MKDYFKMMQESNSDVAKFFKSLTEPENFKKEIGKTGFVTSVFQWIGVKLWNEKQVIAQATKSFMEHIYQDDIKKQYISFAKETFKQQGNNYMIEEFIKKKEVEEESKEKEKEEEPKEVREEEKE